MRSAMSISFAFFGKLSGLLGIFLVCCYAPDLDHHVYKCDRGKCPDGLYCADNLFCGKPIDECAVLGIKLNDTTALCLSRVNSTSDQCNGALTSRMSCTQQGVTADLCMGLQGADCAYCCRK